MSTTPLDALYKQVTLIRKPGEMLLLQSKDQLAL